MGYLPSCMMDTPSTKTEVALKLWRHILLGEVCQNTKGIFFEGIHKLGFNGIAPNQYWSCPLWSGKPLVDPLTT
jgi:hypothetical protein